MAATRGACLRAATVEHRPVYEEPLALMACMVGGQFAGAEFLQTHPAGDWPSGAAKPARAKYRSDTERVSY